MADDGNLGLGVILGDPTGFSANYHLSLNQSIDGAVAWDFSGEDDIYLHSTYLFHHPQSIKIEKINLGWYFGLGARAIFHNRSNSNDDDVNLGIRGALGANFKGIKTPLEVFLELAPVMEFVEDTDFDMDAGIGFRYYF